MTIDQIIRKLKKIRKHGNFEIALLTDTPDGYFHFDYDFKVDIIEPTDEFGRLEDPVCVIGWEECFGSDENDLPEFNEVKKPYLKLV